MRKIEKNRCIREKIWEYIFSTGMCFCRVTFSDSIPCKSIHFVSIHFVSISYVKYTHCGYTHCEYMFCHCIYLYDTYLSASSEISIYSVHNRLYHNFLIFLFSVLIKCLKLIMKITSKCLILDGSKKKMKVFAIKKNDFQSRH
jgi:hypothetical protein